MYFFLQASPLQFKVCAIFQLSIDFGEYARKELGATNPDTCHEAIIVQRLLYGNAPPTTALLDDDDLEQALALVEE